MINKISDFKISESILKSICRENGVSFVDAYIDFEDNSGSKNGCLEIGQTKNVAHTIYKIIANYINKSEIIVGKDLFGNNISTKEDFLIRLASILRSAVYQKNVFSDYLDELTLGRLYQNSFIWILMKDIICPIYKIPLYNIRIVSGITPYIDIARYYEEGDVQKDDKINYPFIFVNQIDNKVVKNAFLFVETLRAYKLEPLKVLKNLFETDLYDKFIGLLKLSFDEENIVEEFISVLITILGIDWKSFVAKKANSVELDKVAQMIQNPDSASQWWYLGVLERMLEPVRGPNWDSYYELGQLSRDFWDEVEKIKAEKKSKTGEVGIPFDSLLRLKTKNDGFKTDPQKTLQALLSSNRIW